VTSPKIKAQHRGLGGKKEDRNKKVTNMGGVLGGGGERFAGWKETRKILEKLGGGESRKGGV